MLRILQLKLKIFSSLMLKKYKPKIIAISGSVGKTSTKEAVYAVLRTKYRARRNIKNYNNEIGLPLTIIGEESGGSNPFKWFNIFWNACLLITIRDKNYPEILILEMGMDRPGDLEYLTSFIRPDISIVTAIGDIPVHLEFFKDAGEIAEEKSKIISALPSGGLAILNYDDPVVISMKEKTRAKTMTYGFSEGADVRAGNYRVFQKEGGSMGIYFKVFFEGDEKEITLLNTLGKPQAYSVLVGICAGISSGMTLTEIVKSLSEYKPLPGRASVLMGIKSSLIIDDSYNAAPLSMEEALRTLKSLSAKRKIAALGDMKELGEMSETAHIKIGDLAAGIADILICVGEMAKFIADEAIKKGFNKKKVFVFDSSKEAAKIMDGLINEGDLILIKGSQGARMEVITEEIMAEPEKAEQLLVRQDKSWNK